MNLIDVPWHLVAAHQNGTKALAQCLDNLRGHTGVTPLPSSLEDARNIMNRLVESLGGNE